MKRKRITLRAKLKSATTAAIARHSFGGQEKEGGYKPRPVTLPTLETARRLLAEIRNDERAK